MENYGEIKGSQLSFSWKKGEEGQIVQTSKSAWLVCTPAKGLGNIITFELKSLSLEKELKSVVQRAS